MKTSFRIRVGILLGALVLGPPAPGADARWVRRGTREIFVSGFVDPDGGFDTEWALEAGYGWFLRDSLEIGGFIGLFDNGRDLKEGAMGAFGELHFPLPFPGIGILPYLGLRLGVVDVEEQPVPVPLPATGGSPAAATGRRPLDETAFEATLRPGVKYFLSRAVALDLGINLCAASESVYVNDGELEDFDWAISGGLRVFF